MLALFWADFLDPSRWFTIHHHHRVPLPGLVLELLLPVFQAAFSQFGGLQLASNTPSSLNRYPPKKIQRWIPTKIVIFQRGYISKASFLVWPGRCMKGTEKHFFRKCWISIGFLLHRIFGNKHPDAVQQFMRFFKNKDFAPVSTLWFPEICCCLHHPLLLGHSQPHHVSVANEVGCHIRESVDRLKVQSIMTCPMTLPITIQLTFYCYTFRDFCSIKKHLHSRYQPSPPNKKNLFQPVAGAVACAKETTQPGPLKRKTGSWLLSMDFFLPILQHVKQAFP